MTPDQLRVALVVNPLARRGKARAQGDLVAQALARAGVHCTRIESVDTAQSQQLVRAQAANVHGLVLVGGDGLVHSMVQLPEFRAKPFAVFPAGSGNDFAKVLGFSSEPGEFTRALLASFDSPMRIDAASALVGGAAEHTAGKHAEAAASAAQRRWFAGSMGFGLVARVNQRANRIRLPLGPIGYQLALLRELLVGRIDAYRLGCENATLEHRALLYTVMNIPLLGGGICLVPRADPRDAKLDLIRVAPARRRRLFSVLPLLAQAKHEDLPEITLSLETEFTLDGEDLLAYADGDLVGTGPFHVRVEPGALSVWAPLDSPLRAQGNACPARSDR